MSEHSDYYSPSGAKTWLNCAGSAILNHGKRDSGNKYSTRGTMLHDFAERNAFDVPFDDIDYSGLNPDDARAVKTAIIQAINLQGWMGDVNDVEIHLELQVKAPDVPDCFGTIDIFIFNRAEKHLLIADYKFGSMYVEVKMNPQLLIYALGGCEYLESRHSGSGWEGIENITLAIIQPAVDDEKPMTFSLSKTELEAWEEEVFLPAVDDIEGLKRSFSQGEVIPLKVFNPGPDQCQWCRSKKDGTCPALQAEVDQAVEEMKLPAIPEVDSTDWVEVMNRVELVKQWAKAREEQMMELVTSGQAPQGFKAVRGRMGNRAWGDEEAADRWLKSQGLKEKERNVFKLKSPPQIEKLLTDLTPQKKANFEKLITRSEGKLSWAYEDDRREAVEVVDVNVAMADDDIDAL